MKIIVFQPLLRYAIVILLFMIADATPPYWPDTPYADYYRSAAFAAIAFRLPLIADTMPYVPTADGQPLR